MKKWPTTFKIPVFHHFFLFFKKYFSFTCVFHVPALIFTLRLVVNCESVTYNTPLQNFTLSQSTSHSLKQKIIFKNTIKNATKASHITTHATVSSAVSVNLITLMQHEQGQCVWLSEFKMKMLQWQKAHFRNGESTSPGAVEGIKRLWRQNPLAPPDVSEVNPEVAPGANPGLGPLSPPGLFHRPLIEAQHLGLTQALAALLTMLPSRFHGCFGFRWEVRVVPQFMILQGVELDLWDVVGLDLEMKLPPDPWSWGWSQGGCILPYGEGPVPLEWHGHTVRLIYSLIIGVYQDIRQVGWREALLAVRTPLRRPSRPEPHIKLHRDHKLFDIAGVFHHRRYIPRLPRAFLERSQSYVSQRRCKSWVRGRSMEEEQWGGRMGMLEALGWMARPSETPRSLVVAGSLVEEMKRGEEDELRLLDGGQVELEHIFAVQDSWGIWKEIGKRLRRLTETSSSTSEKTEKNNLVFILSSMLFIICRL